MRPQQNLSPQVLFISTRGIFY